MKSSYILPTKRKGEAKEVVTIKVDPDFWKALQVHAKAETKREGIKIAPVTVLTTLALRGSKELRGIFKQLKSKRNDALKRQKEGQWHKLNQEQF